MAIEAAAFLEDPDTWGDPGKRPFGMTEQQTDYCRARLAGNNVTESARAAGYSGDRKALAAAGSRAENSAKVREFLRQMREKLDAEQHDILTMDEALKRLTRMARTGVAPQSELKALEALMRYHANLQKESDRRSDRELLDAMCQSELDSGLPYPFLTMHCIVLAGKNNWPGLRDWRTPAENLKRLERYPALVEMLVEAGCGEYLSRSTAPKGNGIAQKLSPAEHWKTAHKP